MTLANSSGLLPEDDPAQYEGIVIDNVDAKQTGKWTSGTGLKGFLGADYMYASAGSGATVRFETKMAESGKYDIRIAYQPHKNRGANVPVHIVMGSKSVDVPVNMTQPPEVSDRFHSLGQFELVADQSVAVVISTENSGGIVHADAVWISKTK